MDERVETTKVNETVVKTKKKGELPPYAQRLPEHLTNLVRLVKNNAEIRRFTALGILNYLSQKGEIKGTKKYCSFKWNKFIVSTDGWSKVYTYKEPFFINCLVASFSSFANAATKTIDEFVKKEIQDSSSINEEETQKIVEQITSSKDDDVIVDNGNE